MDNENKQHTSPEHTNGIDPREADVITEARFFEPYKAEIKELFTALGREEEWSEEPSYMLSYMRRGWIGLEHGDATQKDQFSEEQVSAAMKVLEKMNLTTELLPKSKEKFTQTIVLGATTTALARRFALTKLAREQGVELGPEIVLGGQRAREAVRDWTNEALMNPRESTDEHDYSENTWAAHAFKMIAESSESDEKSWNLTEADLTRIAMLKTIDPNLQPHRIDLALTSVNGQSTGLRIPVEGAPVRETTDHYFETEDGHEIIILNAAAVERRNNNGQIMVPRHTTASEVQEWIERHPPEYGARVLFVTGNPHSIRTAQDAYKVLAEMGRDDIELVVAGTSPAANVPIQTYLGEVARLIDNDYLRNYQN